MSSTATDSAPAPQSVWRRAWEGWKKIAHAIGVFQTRLIMTLLYFIVVLPVGIVVRLVSDPLHLRKPKESNWQRVEPNPRSIESAHQQF